MAMFGILSSVAQSNGDSYVPKCLIPWTKMSVAEVKAQIIDPANYDGKNKLGQPIVIVVGYYYGCGPCVKAWRQINEDLNKSTKCIAVWSYSMETFSNEMREFCASMGVLTRKEAFEGVPVICIIETDGTIYERVGFSPECINPNRRFIDKKDEAFMQAYLRLKKK